MTTSPDNSTSPRKKRGGLLQAGAIVSSMTLISRILGFVRDQVLAIFFGAGAVTDVFLVAWKIPNFLRKLFAEGAFAQGFIPVFTEYKERRGEAELKELAACVSGTLIAIVLVVSTLGVMLAPFLVMLFAPGFSGSEEQFDLATKMLRITFPYLFFVSLLAYSGSILNTFGRFAIPSLTPVLLNICMILAAVYLSPHFEQPIVALAWGVLIAGVVQLAFQLPFLASLNLIPRPRWGLANRGVRRILKLMGPVILGSSVAQINILLDTIIASFLMLGSLSWLYYSERLMQFPLGLLGVALATVILPRLATGHTNAQHEDFKNTLDWAIKLVVVFGLPAAAALLLLATPLLSTLFEYGEFKPRDTRMASYSLMAYSLGVPAFILTKVFLPAFFSRQDTRTPVRIGIISLVSNMIFNILLVVPMVLLDFVAPHTGLAIASSMSAWQQAWLLYRKLGSSGIYQLSKPVLKFAARSLPALLVMAVVIVVGSVQPWNPEPWSEWQAFQRASTLVVIILLAIISYGVTLWMSGVRPADLLSKSAE